MVNDRKQRVPRFHTLDGMRGIAALLVVVYHFGLGTNSMVPLGYLAVDLFFALSGFVIAMNYEETLLTARLGTKAFMRMRFIRLYPLYAFGFLIGMVKQFARVTSLDGETLLSGIKLSAGFLLGVFVLPVPSREAQLFPLNPPSWSLFIELLVNILFALLLVRASNRVLLLIVAAAFLELAITVAPPYYLDLGWNLPTLGGGVARVMMSFPIGMLLWRITRGWKRRASWLALLPIFLLPVVLCIRASAQGLPMLELADVLLVFPAILLAGIVWEPPIALIKIFAFLGDISYPIYIIHSPLTFVFARIMTRTSMSPIYAGLLFAAAMAGIAAIIAHFFDRPVRKWLNRRMDARFSAPEQVL